MTFTLSAFVTVGDAATTKLTLDVDERLREQLQAMIDHCSANLSPET